jgi:GNAT superfamily N-acetyltransferase
VDKPCVDRDTAVTLLDGPVVSVHRLQSTDIHAVLALHENLADRDRYLRFFAVHPSYLKCLVTKPTDDNTNQYALGAFDTDRLICVANYTKTNDPDTGEVALAVAHDQHLLGVGTALLRHLAQIARHNGIGRLVADILAENHPMLKGLSDAGWRHSRKVCGPGRRGEAPSTDVPIEISFRRFRFGPEPDRD